jgi:DNA polymerase IV
MEDRELGHTMSARSFSPTSTISLPDLDLSKLPLTAILPAHLKDDEKKKLEETLRRHNAPLATDVSKAKLFIGRVATNKRAGFELRSRKFVVEESIAPKRSANPVEDDHRAKRRKASETPAGSVEGMSSLTASHVIIIDDSETEDEAPPEGQRASALQASKACVKTAPPPSLFEDSSGADIVWVVRTTWLDDCVSAGRLLPLDDNLVLKGKVLERPKSLATTSRKPALLAADEDDSAPEELPATRPESGRDILERARSDATATTTESKNQPRQLGSHSTRRFEGKSFTSTARPVISHFGSHTAQLLQQTTSEYEGVDSEIPRPPDWVTKGVIYACQRLTPAHGPNQDFIEQLKKIRTARTLIDDDVGVRAYSSMIASIAAYPYKLSHPRELLQLPACEGKAAVLFVEWKNSGKIQAVEDFENDEDMKILRLFYDIWGVGAKTARQFYYNNNWKELDDIIEFGWHDLDRVQQIGVKFYEEFKNLIPRKEVEHIASVIREHAVKLRDDQITVTIVGGYRRGKPSSGDVDVIVSHPNLASTAGLVREIVESLETSEWITHTLTLSLTNTKRGQSALPFRSAKGPGVGFDTLDKALVVWQDPTWPTREDDLAKNPKAKNPNIHRRVDIIVAPWRTVGCAVLGWSGGTTFQRDLRRYAKHAKGWKFDSSGIRSRDTGEAVLLEGLEGVDGSPEDAEKRVFEGLGLEYVPPEYRVTY